MVSCALFRKKRRIPEHTRPQAGVSEANRRKAAALRPEMGSLERSEEYKPRAAKRVCLCSESERKRPGREGTEA